MKNPRISPDAKLFPGAAVIGDVEVGPGASLWYNTVVRADTTTIRIGARSNIQDGTVIHCDHGFPVSIGENVTVGHACVVHGCSVGDGSLIGMGSLLMNGAKVGAGCIIGAGSLLTGGTEVPDGMMALGRPAKVVRPLTEEEKAGALASAAEYKGLAELGMQSPGARVLGE